MNDKTKVFTLPMTAKVGETFEINGSGPWILKQPETVTITDKRIPYPPCDKDMSVTRNEDGTFNIIEELNDDH